jgi:KilA-N domain
MQLALSLINRQIENSVIPQRAADGYINATAMCKAVGKQFNDYWRIGPTQEFLKELSAETGLPVSGLVVTFKGGKAELQGTWVHPDVAINLGQWCSPRFAVAVARWVREWMSGTFTTKLPYHLERYMANRAAIPINRWSMLNEMTFNLIAPLEQEGYHLPEELVPDISEGKMFCKWLRDEKKIDTTKLPTYRHIYADGRIVDAKLYPLSVLEDFREHFFKVWLPEKAEGYFRKKDPKALPHLSKLVPLSLEGTLLDDVTAKAGFEKIKGKIAAAPDPLRK